MPQEESTTEYGITLARGSPEERFHCKDVVRSTSAQCDSQMAKLCYCYFSIAKSYSHDYTSLLNHTAMIIPVAKYRFSHIIVNHTRMSLEHVYDTCI